jgi:predicted transposase YbfD/YdcC
LLYWQKLHQKPESEEASMDYITLSPELELPSSLSEVAPSSIYAAFQQVSDGRHKRGIRYPLALILTLIVLAKLAGEPKLSGVCHWVRLRGTWLNEHLHLQRTSWPAASTYTYVLDRIDPQEVTQAIQQCLTRAESRRRCGTEPSRLLGQAGREQKAHLALDGKTMRGTLSHEAARQPSVHLLSLYEVSTGIMLAQRAVASKENEISAVPDLLLPVLIKGRIWSADAMHTQKKMCRQLTQNGGDYVLIAKDNQPTTRSDLELFFEDPEADRSDWQSTTTCEKGHGRLEKRTLTTSTGLTDYFAKQWPGIAQVFRLERSVSEKGQHRSSVVYGFTSLSPKRASAKFLLELNRSHWSIENRSHWRRDVILGEDHSQVRTGRAPEVLAALNTTVLALMDFLHVPNVANQMRFYQAHPLEALRLLFLKL